VTFGTQQLKNGSPPGFEMGFPSLRVAPVPL